VNEIEHDLDVIRGAGLGLDLGPDAGGRVLVAGRPEGRAAHAGAHPGCWRSWVQRS
jgi:excinuclease UvrABC ATPase subunit